MSIWNRIAYKLGWTRMKRGKHVQFPKQAQTEGRLRLEDGVRVICSNPDDCVTIGKDVKICERTTIITAGGSLQIGEGSQLGANNYITCQGGVEIGAHVLSASNLSMISSEHQYQDVDLPILDQGSKHAPIKIGKFPYQNVAYVPDGIRMEKQETSVSYENKKNVLLTVGRNGTAQKRTDVLLEAFAKAAPQIEGWELRIVGSIEPSFQSYLTEYFTLHPELKNRVFFVGEVQEKAALQQEYAQAKIFCLPSDWESFGIVNVEAMAAGCTVITTDYPAARDIVDGERYGRIIPFGDSEALAQKMIELCHNTAYLKNNCEVVQKYAYEQFSYDVIANIIHQWIQLKLNKRKEG